MKFYVYASTGLIGWSELPYGDPPMGVVYGPFHPTINYGPLGILIREQHKYDMLGKNYDPLQLQRIQERIKQFDIRAVAEDHYQLQPTAGVHFTDYSQELGDDGYEITLLGLPEEEYRQYFPVLYRQYFSDDG
jgi:hypothetical protein